MGELSEILAERVALLQGVAQSGGTWLLGFIFSFLTVVVLLVLYSDWRLFFVYFGGIGFSVTFLFNGQAMIGATQEMYKPQGTPEAEEDEPLRTAGAIVGEVSFLLGTVPDVTVQVCA